MSDPQFQHEEFRRSVEGEFSRYEMDDARRAIYVEGVRDVLLLRHLKIESTTCLVIPIAAIDIDDGSVESGNRARLISFAKLACGARLDAQIKCFVDRDFSDALSEITPSNVILSDYVDMEGYILNEPTLSKALSLGAGKDDVDVSALLEAAISSAEKIYVMRFQSKVNGWKLKINAALKHKHVIAGPARVGFDFQKLMRSVLVSHNAEVLRDQHISEPELLPFSSPAEIQKIPSPRVRGKDVLFLLDTWCEKQVTKSISLSACLWSALETHRLHAERAIQCLIDFSQEDK